MRHFKLASGWAFLLLVIGVGMSVPAFGQKGRAKPKLGELNEALKLVKQGKYEKASIELFKLSQNPRFESQRLRIRYVLGLMLYQMKLYQTAAFQFISVIKEGQSEYLKPSIEKLSLAANALDDDTLLNYAVSRVSVEEFPKTSQDMLFFRVGEYQLRSGLQKQAAESLSRIPSNSMFYSKAKYLEGLALAEAKEEKKALRSFEDLLESRSSSPVTDPVRVAAQMGKARVLYQMKNWDEAISAYRAVPRDTESWHQALFESSWAMVRGGRFRSALSNFQSLHSAFYEEFYLPESLLLRSIVYLYICQYDEMEKVLNLFTRVYDPVYEQVTNYLDRESSLNRYFADVAAGLKILKTEGEARAKKKVRLPIQVIRRVVHEGNFQRSYQYIRTLQTEKRRIRRLSSEWRNSALGKIAQATLVRRISGAQKRAGRQVRDHLQTIRQELVDFTEQEGFIRFEMINGKKEKLKMKVAERDLPATENAEDQATQSRDYYVQAGYEYWPFRGEYWLDELGAYQYVGTRTCQ